MVDMGCRVIDDINKVGHKLKAVSCDIKELAILSNLTQSILVV